MNAKYLWPFSTFVNQVLKVYPHFACSERLWKFPIKYGDLYICGWGVRQLSVQYWHRNHGCICIEGLFIFEGTQHHFEGKKLGLGWICCHHLRFYLWLAKIWCQWTVKYRLLCKGSCIFLLGNLLTSSNRTKPLIYGRMHVRTTGCCRDIVIKRMWKMNINCLVTNGCYLLQKDTHM